MKRWVSVYKNVIQNTSEIAHDPAEVTFKVCIFIAIDKL